MTGRLPLIVADSAIPFLKGRLENYADIKYLPVEEITASAVRDADALIIRTRTRCDAGLLEGSSVKCIATATIGTDHIDREACRRLGISVFNAPGCNAPGVAQWVWSAILEQGYAPEKTTVGIVGLGNVGRIVAEWGRALGFRLLVNDPPLEDSGAGPAPFAPCWTPLPDLLGKADIITFHTPLTKDGPYPTYHLLDSTALDRTASGTLILNAARGGVIDEEALIPHLSRGRLSAILDTWEGEPHINLRTVGEVMLGTPHIAGYSHEGKQRATRMAVSAITGFFGFPEPEMDDLEPPYSGAAPGADAILASYSLVPDALRLFENPEHFEQLRSQYIYRHEPLSGHE